MNSLETLRVPSLFFYKLSDGGYQLFGVVPFEYECVGAGSQGRLACLRPATEGDHLQVRAACAQDGQQTSP